MTTSNNDNAGGLERNLGALIVGGVVATASMVGAIWWLSWRENRRMARYRRRVKGRG